MDHSFTKLVQDWLAAEPAQRDYSVGALYLLRLSGNQIMYRNIVAAGADRRGDFIEYQLRKYISFRLADLTHQEVQQMSEQVERIVEEHIPLAAAADQANSQLPIPNSQPAKGKRADHDSLPDEIKACYVENLSLLQKMRELHLKLRSLTLDPNITCPDSERYPFLKELIALDKRLRKNWQRYDSYRAS